MGRSPSIPAEPIARLARELRLIPAAGRRRLVDRCLAAMETIPQSDAATTDLSRLLRAMTGTEARDYGRGNVVAGAARQSVLAFILLASERAGLPWQPGDRTESEVARACGVTERTLRRWRRDWLPAVWREREGRRTLAIPSQGREAIERRGLATPATRHLRTTALERARLGASAAALVAAGVKGKEVVAALARQSNRSPDTIRRALGRTRATRANARDRTRAWRMWLRGIPSVRIAERLGVTPVRLRSMILAARAAWLLESIPPMAGAALATTGQRATWQSMAGVGSGLPAWPHAMPTSAGATAARAPRELHQAAAHRLAVVRTLLATARAQVVASARAVDVDDAESLARWASLLVRAEAEPVLLDLLRRARRELGTPPESLPPSTASRLFAQASRIAMGAVLLELADPARALPAAKSAPLQFSRVLAPLRERTRGSARATIAERRGDPFASLIPWDVHLDSRALRRGRDSWGAWSELVERRLGLDGQAPRSILQLASHRRGAPGPLFRTWERLSVG